MTAIVAEATPVTHASRVRYPNSRLRAHVVEFD